MIRSGPRQVLGKRPPPSRHRHRCGRRNGRRRWARAPVEQRGSDAGGGRPRPLRPESSRMIPFSWAIIVMGRGCWSASSSVCRVGSLVNVIFAMRADDPLPRRHGPRALRLHRRHARPRSRRRRPGGRTSRRTARTLDDVSRPRRLLDGLWRTRLDSGFLDERAARVFIATITLLCLNLLIAFLTDAYTQVSEDKDKAFAWTRAAAVVETGERVRQGILPPPLNILQMHASMVGVCTGRSHSGGGERSAAPASRC